MMIFFFVSVYFSRFLLLRNLTGVFLLRRSDYKNIGKEGESEQFFRFNQSGQDTYYLSAYREGRRGWLCEHIPARFTGGGGVRQNIKLYSVAYPGYIRNAGSTGGAFE